MSGSRALSRRSRGAPLGRRGLVAGVAVLVVVGAALRMGAGDRAGQVAAPLRGLPAFPSGALPADAPRPQDTTRFAAWARDRAMTDWEAAFRRAGRAWSASPATPDRGLPAGTTDPAAWMVMRAGLDAAGHVERLLGLPGRVELARRDDPASADRLAQEARLRGVCLAAVWGRTLLPADRLAATQPAVLRPAVAAGAATGDPASC